MDWQNIIQKLRQIKEHFDRSYKCLNVDRPTGEQTIGKHLTNLFVYLEQIRIIVNVNYERLTAAHKIAAEAFYSDVRLKLLNVAAKKGISVEIPDGHSISIDIPQNISGTQTEKIESKKENNMTAQTVLEFINTATKLIPDFDGKPENLRSFLDALSLIDTLKGTHETVAITLIKTKLKGNARNLLENESTIQEVIGKLSGSVKGESVEVLSAKILNIKQNNKSANNYCSEIEALTKSLENAYISDGLSTGLATKYSTQVAVRAMTKNCNYDRVKLVMEAGNFGNMNEAIGKFVSSCTEATGQQTSVLYYKNKTYNNYRGKRHNRGGRRGNNNSYNNNNGRNNNSNYRGNRRGQYNRRNGNGQNANVMVTDAEHPENRNVPLRTEN